MIRRGITKWKMEGGAKVDYIEEDLSLSGVRDREIVEGGQGQASKKGGGGRGGIRPSGQRGVWDVSEVWE